jgi:hypothetical protein
LFGLQVQKKQAQRSNEHLLESEVERDLTELKEAMGLFKVVRNELIRQGPSNGPQTAASSRNDHAKTTIRSMEERFHKLMPEHVFNRIHKFPLTGPPSDPTTPNE